MRRRAYNNDAQLNLIEQMRRSVDEFADSKSKQTAAYSCACCGKFAITGERFCGQCAGRLDSRGRCVLCQCRRIDAGKG